MTMVRCPTCNRKIDTSFYGACLDCGTMLPIEGLESAPSPAPLPEPTGWEPEPATLESGQAFEAAASTSEPAAGAQPSVLARIGGGLLIRLILLGVFLGGGAIWGFLTSADRSEGGSIIDAGTLGAAELQIGDCLDWPGSGGDDIEVFDSVNARPCSDPHDMEVFAIVEYPSVSGTAYPGDDALTDWGFDKCFAGFHSYIGAPYQQVPDVDITIFWPSEDGWREDDRTVHCLMVAYEDGVKLTGSLLGRDA